MKRDFTAITDFSKEEIYAVFDLARELKTKTKSRQEHHLLKGKTLGMIFQKPSNRTRVSFEVGMYQLGGHALYLGPTEIGLGKRESTADVARVLARYVDGIMARVFGHDIIVDFAKYADVPVINGLSDLLHPCQILGDMLTIIEHKGKAKDWTITYLGDGNNIVNSWINLSRLIPMHLKLGVPEGYEPNAELLEQARRIGVSEIQVLHDPVAAARDADVLYTDVWASMGQEAEAEARKNIFRPFAITSEILSRAKANCIVLHCLPAHRGDEISDAVIDGPQSVVFDEAENRLHIQKAILVKLMQ
ncbi:ornithine carbamoyltransferase [candidate division KSB1 bacterium]|nr:ornithine carbamoyltransferase [candidate division KSB1 bacterium]